MVRGACIWQPAKGVALGHNAWGWMCAWGRELVVSCAWGEYVCVAASHHKPGEPRMVQGEPSCAQYMQLGCHEGG